MRPAGASWSVAADVAAVAGLRLSVFFSFRIKSGNCFTFRFAFECEFEFEFEADADAEAKFTQLFTVYTESENIIYCPSPVRSAIAALFIIDLALHYPDGCVCIYAHIYVFVWMCVCVFSVARVLPTHFYANKSEGVEKLVAATPRLINFSVSLTHTHLLLFP